MKEFLKSKMNTGVKSITAIALIAGVATTAHAGTTYHVYQKGESSTCDISTKSPDDYNRGSQYHLIGVDSTRSGAKEIGEDAGCTSF